MRVAPWTREASWTLNDVFRFKHMEPSASQDANKCKELAKSVIEFIKEIEDDVEITVDGEYDEEMVCLDPFYDDRALSVDKFSKEEWKELERVIVMLADEGKWKRGDVRCVQWFPKYAGVLQMQYVGVDTVHVRILALDGWERVLHFLPNADEPPISCAESTSSKFLNCGEIAEHQRQDFLDSLHHELQEAMKLKGDQRHAYSDAEAVGHQKTPTFLKVVVLKAMASLPGYEGDGHIKKPQGGMTDVGLHTGGTHRDTCWPLVHAALREALRGHGVLFTKALLRFKTQLLERELIEFQDEDIVELTPAEFYEAVNVCFQMLESVADEVLDLGNKRYNIASLQRSCTYYRRQLDDAARRWSDYVGRSYQLPTSSKLQELENSLQGPKIVSPERVNWGDFSIPTAGVKEYALRQVEAYEFLDTRTSTADKLLEYLSTVDAAKQTFKTQAAMASIEQFLYDESKYLLSGDQVGSAVSSSTQLHELTSWYRKHMQVLESEPKRHDVVTVQERSRYLLVLWIAYCRSHQMCLDTCSQLSDYGIPLDWEKLEVCVLDQKEARDALQNVAAYLRTWDLRGLKPLFELSLGKQAPTIAFGNRMGQDLPKYRARLGELRNEVTDRLNRAWCRVEEKKTIAAELRTQISQESAEVDQLERLLKEEQASLLRCRRYSNWQTQEYERQINWKKSRVSQLEKKLQDAKKLDEFVRNPLPENSENALTILFFLDMPEELGALADLCCLAQQELNPTAAEKLHIEDTSWKEHVQGYTSTKGWVSYLSPLPRDLRMTPSRCPSTIDQVHSFDDLKRQCLGFPSGYENVDIGWSNGNRGVYLNPFRISKEDAIEWFTAGVPSRQDAKLIIGEGLVEDWQWLNQFPGGGADRGNLVYAKSGSHRQASVDFRGFDCLSSLRAYPLQQLRNVFSAVEGDILDWSEPIVATVVRQAIYQVGELTGAKYPTFLWHDDLNHQEECEAFVLTLERLVAKIEASPARRWNSIYLLGEIAGFLTQYSPSAKSLVTRLVSVARKLANEALEELKLDVSGPKRSQLRTRECLLYGYAVLSYDLAAQLSETDLHAMCKLLIKFRYSLIFADDENFNEEKRKITWGVHTVMAHRVHEISSFLTDHPDAISGLCQSVISSIPLGLSWSQVQPKDSRKGHFTSSFQSFDESTEVHYLLNMATGLILINGNPPSGLPESLRQLPKYDELFGRDQDFEVTLSNGVFATVHRVYGSHYKFAVKSDELFVEEIVSDRTLQLCQKAWVSEFSQIVPPRLKELCSHWYWLEAGCVVLRPRPASSKTVSVLICFDGDKNAVSYQVPPSYQAFTYEEIKSVVKSFSSFVSQDDALLRVLGKFEHPSFVHMLRSPLGKLEVEFPRFGLHFVQEHLGRLKCTTYRDYALDMSQQYNDAFARSQQHLVLYDTSDAGKRKRLVIVPAVRMVMDNEGKTLEECLPVEINADGNVVVQVPTDSGASLRVSAFTEHPRLKWLKAESIETRLHLAVIYAASGCHLPSPSLQMTAGEAALETLRGCFPSRPFSKEALERLRNIRKYSHHTPVLRLMVGVLLKRSRRLDFLFCDAVQSRGDLSNDERDEYDVLCGASQSGKKSILRQGLTPVEVQMLTGDAHVRQMSQWSDQERSFTPIELDDVPVDYEFVEKIEKTLWSMITQPPAEVKPFPISQRGSNAMCKEMTEELEESWRIHCQHPDKILSSSLDSLIDTLREMLKIVSNNRARLERYLFESIKRAQSDWRDVVMSSVARLPSPRFADLIRSTFDKSILLHLAPRLSQASRVVFRQATLQMLELCVLEDKLERIIGQSQKNSRLPSTYFVEELSTIRKWKSAEHPYWLAFEVEGQLQIRPEQFAFAQKLIDNPGSVCQLNMGRGKTRVVLPMLFLYFNYRKRGRVVRAHFLAPLLSEARQVMHRELSAGVLRLPFIELPFDRKTQLLPNDVLRMVEAVNDIKRAGGFLLIASEHRLSLDLGRLVIRRRSSVNNSRCSDVGEADESSSAILDAMDQLLNDSEYLDVFDESDAILHHNYHLVYADGEEVELDERSNRCTAAEWLLHVLMSPKSESVRRLLATQRDLWCSEPEYALRPGSFDGFRLNAELDTTVEQHLKSLREAFIDDLCDNPPFEMKWLRQLSTEYKSSRPDFSDMVTNPGVDVETALSKLPQHFREFKPQILALRGLLAFGVLEYCLEKRNRVNYGLPMPGARSKLMAIPFTAADLPADRSEYSHPDVAIVLTLLAYYHRGLLDDEVKKTFEELFRLDASEQNRYYSEWFESVRGHSSLEDDERQELENVEDLVLSNASQFELLCKVYKHSMVVITFYLNCCVFPRDTKQYPRRLSRSAWDLTKGGDAIGFSGTNDNHRLLPLGITQREPNEPSLRATNGRMVDLLRVNTREYSVLSGEPFNVNESVKSSGNTLSVWQSLLRLACDEKCNALIDTGALLAGVPTYKAAIFLAKSPRLPESVAGITYYDTRKTYDCWVVLERTKKLVTPLKSSPIHERDTFVIFDEARSRGSDMKLLSDACALLTLGPKMTKDKLMQGAGRLRQLGCDQKLWLTSTKEVERSIRQVTGCELGPIGVMQVLQWVVESTQQQCTLGLLEWGQSGIDYCGKESDSKLESKDDDWSLEYLYGGARSPMKIATIIQDRVKNSSAAGDLLKVLEEVGKHGNRYGREDEVLVTSLSEECEREVQEEKKIQVEELELGGELEPLKEEEWNFEQLFRANAVKDLGSDAGIDSMKVKSNTYFKSLIEVDWNQANLYGTKNFWKTVEQPDSPPELRSSKHLRTIDSLVVFKDLCVLLLTRFETDAILKLLRTHRLQDTGCFRLVQLEFLFGAMRRCHDKALPLSDVPLSIGYPTREALSDVVLPSAVMTACRLFNGDTDFLSKSHPQLTEKTLRLLLDSMQDREKTLREFIEECRSPQRWNRSWLHELTVEMHYDEVASGQKHVILSLPNENEATKAA